MKRNKNDLWDILAILALVLLVAFCVAFGCEVARGQNVVRKGNTFVQQSTKKKAEEPTMTQYTYIDADGIKYPIYKSSKGKLFIIKKSKKTGKEYKMYLPAVTKELQQQK